MKKKLSVSSPHGKRVPASVLYTKMRGKRLQTELARLANRKDEDIDYSDIPANIDWSKAEMGKFYRPQKKAVTMRLDEDVLRWLKGFGRGYQTRANALLRHAMVSTETLPVSKVSRPSRKAY